MKARKSVLPLTYFFTLILFASVAYFSYGYDDEYFNITSVEKTNSIVEYYRWVNSTDIHPPLSYLINYALFNIFANWRIVRCIGAMAVATGLWLFWVVRDKNTLKVAEDRTASIFSYMLICLNPTVLLWATGVRWYTYMTLMVCILGMLFYAKGILNENKYLFWGSYFLICVIMFHIEYSGAILILASFVCFLLKRKSTLKCEWYVVLLFGLLAIVAVSYQSYIFFTVHYPNGGHEIGSVWKALVYTAQHLLCGQAVMPVSLFGILLLLGNSILYITMLIHCKKMWRTSTNRFFVLSCVGIIISGIGIKIRNYTPLSSILGGACRDTYSLIKAKCLKYACFGLILIGTAGGLYNVVAHVNTTKGSWNTPYKDIVEYVLQYDAVEDVMVVSHNPVVDYWLEQEGDMTVLNIANDYKGWYEKVLEHQGLLIILDSYKGSLHTNAWLKLEKFVEESQEELMKYAEFGKDDYAWFKQILDKDYPDYYMKIYVMKRELDTKE